MTAMANYLESSLIQHLFRTGTFTKPTVVAIALCTSAPTDASTGATIPEVSDAGSYARYALNPLDANWANVTAGDGTTNNVGAATFTTATGDWGTISHVAILDNTTHGAGNLFFWGALTASKVVGNGDTFQFSAAQLTIRIDD